MPAHGPGRWFSFRGRARRREFVLQSTILLTLSAITDRLALAAVDAGIGGSTPVAADLLTTVPLIVASWAVIYRRLHDFGVRGALVLIPTLCVGAVLGLVRQNTGWAPGPILWHAVWIASAVLLSAIPGTPGPNRFGPPSGLSATADAAAGDGGSDRLEADWREARRETP